MYVFGSNLTSCLGFLHIPDLRSPSYITFSALLCSVPSLKLTVYAVYSLVHFRIVYSLLTTCLAVGFFAS